MIRFLIAVTALILTTGCNNWGDYQYKSEKFNFSMTFPDKWEVWDKSDDARDFLVASIPDKPEAKIEVIVTKTAPDIHVNELYPTFESGGDDAATLQEFGVDEKKSISAANKEGRMIKVHWEGETKNMKGMRMLFLGDRFQMNIRIEMSEDDYVANELDFLKMAHRITL